MNTLDEIKEFENQRFIDFINSSNQENTKKIIIQSITNNLRIFHSPEIKSKLNQTLSLLKDNSANQKADFILKNINSKKTTKKEKSNKQRVLILTIGAFVPSGVVTVTKQLIVGLLKEEIELKVISHWIGRTFPYEIWDPPQLYVNANKENPQDYAKIKYCNLNQILEEISDFDPQIIHVHSWSWADYINGGISEIIKASSKPKLIFTIHSPKLIKYSSTEDNINQRANEYMEEIETAINTSQVYNIPIGEEYYKYNYKQALLTAQMEGPCTEELFNKADKIITISPFHEETMKKNYPQHKNKIVSIHNVPKTGNDIQKITQNEIDKVKKEIAPNDEKLIVYIGRVEKLKGVTLIGQALQILFDKYPQENYKFLGIGGGFFKGAGGLLDKKNLMHWSNIDKKYSHKIQFLGWRNLKSYYAYMSLSNKVNAVVIMPIGTRGLLVVMEAALAKIPVISWAVDDRLAFNTYPKPTNIAKMIELIFDKNNFSQIQNKVDLAAKTAEEEYNFTNYINQHKELYNDVLKK